MGIVEDVNKLAETERDIHRLERLIAFLSSVSDADLGKAWPQVAKQVGNLSQCAEFADSSPKNEASRSIGLFASRYLKTALRLEHRERQLPRSLVLTTAVVLLAAAQFSTYVVSGKLLAAKNSSEEQVVEKLSLTPLNTDPSITSSGTRELENSVKVSGMSITSRPESRALVLKRKQDGQRPTAKFVVTGASFVRARPSSRATILATLEPGTEIEVLNRRGDYYRIRAIKAEKVSGYIHKEDAFFKPIG